MPVSVAGEQSLLPEAACAARKTSENRVPDFKAAVPLLARFAACDPAATGASPFRGGPPTGSKHFIKLRRSTGGKTGDAVERADEFRANSRVIIRQALIHPFSRACYSPAPDQPGLPAPGRTTTTMERL